MSNPSKRRRFAPGLWAAATAGLAGLLVAAGCDFLPKPPPQARTQVEQRGRHLLQIASGCGCHGANLAGWRTGGPDELPRATPFGERFVGPFGLVPAPNITPDRETGIGVWSDEEILQALRDGVRPGGTPLHPIMPWHAYRGMADSDLAALVAYLRRLRPVHNEVPARTLTAPLPEAPARPPSGPARPPTEGVDLGGYLALHVSACTDCHSPRGEPGTEPPGPPLSGNVLPAGGKHILVPNITPDRETGIGAWSRADIARYLRTGSRPDGGLAHSLMAGLIVSSYAHLTPDEADAIAAYLKSLPPARRRL